MERVKSQLEWKRSSKKKLALQQGVGGRGNIYEGEKTEKLAAVQLLKKKKGRKKIRARKSYLAKFHFGKKM